MLIKLYNTRMWSDCLLILTVVCASGSVVVYGPDKNTMKYLTGRIIRSYIRPAKMPSEILSPESRSKVWNYFKSHEKSGG